MQPAGAATMIRKHLEPTVVPAEASSGVVAIAPTWSAGTASPQTPLSPAESHRPWPAALPPHLGSTQGSSDDGEVQPNSPPAPSAAEPTSSPDTATHLRAVHPAAAPLSGLAGALLDSNYSAVPPLAEPGSGDYPVADWERYEFLGLLGRGGMGTVYKARDRRIDRVVALKFIAGGGERLKQRFMQEARMQARMNHPGICKIYETGEVADKAYIAMEFVDGQSLQKAQLRLSLLDKVRLIQQTAEALHVAHEEGIIHRDIKPANVMVCQRADGTLQPVLTDFGLARDVNAGQGLTDSGAVLGTPWYMSPEQTRGEIRTMDRRTDIYSLGATLYELIAGRPPFHSETTVDALVDIMHREAPSLSRMVSNLPPGLDAVVSKCLNKEPSERYATALELVQDLGRLLDKQPVVAKRLGLWPRLRFRARHNRPAATALAALSLSLLTLLGYGIYGRMQTLQRERRDQQRTELAHRLGQTLGQLEALAQLTYAMPLHDARRELAQLRQKMREIETEQLARGEFGSALAHYALGRGHLALHEWRPALEQLRLAEAGGMAEGELYFALGRTLGALYGQELTQARRSGDDSFLRRRQAELDAEYLQPALRYLRRSGGSRSAASSYAAGLIDFYEGHLDAALLHAELARRELTWSYEPLKLIGEIQQSRALAHKGRGDYSAAETSFEAARRAFLQASELGRSDYQLHEAIAEVGIRQMELAGLRKENPKQHLPLVLQSADHALEADPQAAAGHAKRAFAYLFLAQYLEAQGINEGRDAILAELIAAGEQAVAAHPEDEYSHDVLGNGYVFRAKYASEQLQAFDKDLTKARQHFQLAIALNARFPWALNDLGGSYLVQGDDLLSRFLDPTDSYQRAIAAFSQALLIDPEYQNSYVNIAFAHSNIARYLTETGTSPNEQRARCIEMSQRSIAMNKNNLAAASTTSFANIMAIIHLFDTGNPDISTAIMSADEDIQRLASLSSSMVISFQHRAAAYYFLARYRAQHGQDVLAPLATAHSALQECRKRQEGQDPTCAALHAQLAVLQAEQADSRAELETAEAAALSRAALAHELGGNDADVQLAVAETYWRVARLRWRRKLPIDSELAAGTAAIQPVVTRAPSWGRAQAVAAGLAALRSLATRDPRERQRWASTARTTLSAAAGGNPHLRRSYREAFADVAALGPLAAAPAPVSSTASPPPGR